MSRVVHFEIHADEPERAIAFYGNSFGWKFLAWEGSEEYWLITTGPDDQPGINGGLARRRSPIDGEAVIAYVCNIEVASIDEAEAAVTAQGGNIVVPRMAISGVGWVFYAKDTEGNVFGVMQSDPQAK